jgi:hypothetical protein
MAFEGLKNLSSKQKILLPIFVLAVVYIVWQVYDMFGGGAAQSSTPTPAARSTVAMQTQPMVGPSASQAQAQGQLPATMGQSGPGMQQVQPVPTEKNVASLAATSANDDQSQYVQLLNHYQLLKMKRLLLEEEVAISTAQQKIAEMNAKTVSLGGMPDTGVEDMGGYSDSAMAATAPSSSEGGSGEYKVVYIDKQGGDWNATLNRKGRFEEVSIGSELADGTQVISIDSSGVVIKHGTNLTKLTFGGAVALPSAETKGSAEVEQPTETVPVKSVTLQEAQRVGGTVATTTTTTASSTPAVVTMEKIKKKRKINHKVIAPAAVVAPETHGATKEIPVAQPAVQSLPAETIIPVQPDKSAVTVPIKSTEAAPLKASEITTVANAEKKILKVASAANAKVAVVKMPVVATKNLPKTELTIAPVGRAKVVAEKKTKLVVGLEVDPNRKVIAAAKILSKQPGGDVPIAISSNKPRGIGRLACKDHNCGFVPQVDVPTAEQKAMPQHGQAAVQNPDEEIKKLVHKLQDQNSKPKSSGSLSSEDNFIPNTMIASATPAMNEPVLILSKKKAYKKYN